eukprot:jgi/Chlat1/1789/Chrsp134S02097
MCAMAAAVVAASCAPSALCMRLRELPSSSGRVRGGAADIQGAVARRRSWETSVPVRAVLEGNENKNGFWQAPWLNVWARKSSSEPPSQPAASWSSSPTASSSSAAMATAAMQELAEDVAEEEQRLDLLVADERYEEAAQVRDHLEVLRLRLRVMQTVTRTPLKFRVGDVVRHKRYGYKGVIYGHDNTCTASETWVNMMHVDALPHGRDQPFYHVLVDLHDRPAVVNTYVAQENLEDYRVTGSTLIEHPLIKELFVGIDDTGCYRPGRKLRSKYPDDW